MRRFPTRHRFSEWDGSEAGEVDADNALGAMVDDLMEYGDLRWAMRNLFSRGMDIPQGGHMQGLRDMLKQLRSQKRQHLDRFNLGSVFKEIEKELDEILELERGTIDEWLGREEDQIVGDVMRDVAEKNKARLDELPDNAAGKMQELENYEFLNPEAQKRYIELLNQLRRAMTQTFFDDIEKMVNNMSKGDIDRMKDMLKDLNDLLSKKAKGVDPDAIESFFKDFMDQYGDMFGDHRPRLPGRFAWRRCVSQMAAAQSLTRTPCLPTSARSCSPCSQDTVWRPRIGERNSPTLCHRKWIGPRSPFGNRYRFDGHRGH